MRKKLFLLTVIIFGFSVAAWSQQSTNSRQLLDDAIIKVDGDSPETALQELKTIIDKYPNSPESLTAKALYVLYLGQQPGMSNDVLALNLGESYLSNNPNTWQEIIILLNNSTILITQKQFQKAEIMAKEGLKATESISVNGVTDTTFDQCLKVLNMNKSDVRDGFLSILVYALKMQGKQNDINQYLIQISHKNIDNISKSLKNK